MNRRLVLALIGAAALTAGCTGAKALLPSSSPATVTASAARARAGHVRLRWGSALVRRMTLLGAAPQNARMRVYVEVNMKNISGLLRYALLASTPGSPVYRQFLTPQQIAKRFGATAHDYQSVVSYFAARGLHVVTYPQRDMVRVDGSVAQMGRAFNTSFARYRYLTGPAIAPRTPPHLGARLPIRGVLGLVQYRPLPSDGLIRGNITNFSGYTPQQLSHAFDYSGAYSVGYTGAGVNTGVIGTGLINSTDAAMLSATYNYPLAHIALVTPSPTPVATPALSGEAALDTQMVAALAPGARTEYYYYDETANGSDYTGELAMAIAADTADTISESAGSPESQDLQSGSILRNGEGPAQVQYAMLAAEGIAFFASSGDNGSTTANCSYTYMRANCVTYPASDVNAVAVGGLNVPLDDAGNLIGEITAWSTETTGGGPEPAPTANACNCIGSGGGYSIVFKAPWWQRRSLGAKMRELPDIALDSAPQTGGAIVVGGQPKIGNGTSMAAPMANAMWALVLSACKQSPKCATAGGPVPYRLGNPAPLLYSIYHSRAYKTVFYDVLYGDNQPLPPSPVPGSPPPPNPIGYAAGPGYDLVTGIGAPFAGHVIDAIVAGAGAP
jgi:pseudomonalisin